MEDDYNRRYLMDKVSDFWRKIAIFFLCLILAKPYLPLCIPLGFGYFACGYYGERLMIFYALWATIFFKSKNKIKFAITSYSLFTIYLNLSLLDILEKETCEGESLVPVIIFKFLCW